MNPTHIPHGVADYFWAEALERQQLMHQLLATFRTWGYADVMPPMFDYADTLSAQASPELKAELYRLLDGGGRPLALRPEFTTPVVRLVATRLHDWPMPQRFCYAGSVFRNADPQAGRQREFWQAGVELIGASSVQADAEIVALTAQALQKAGLTNFRLVLGQTRYVAGLLADLALSPENEAKLRHAVERKSEAQILDFLREVPLNAQQRRTVEALNNLHGDLHGGIHGEQSDVVLARAASFCLNDEMHAALENLRAITETLSCYQINQWIDLDLTEIRNMGYYTGLTFEALAPGIGFDIASGGRYDDLMAHFGHPQPAVGVALGVDRLLLARHRQNRDHTLVDFTPADRLVMVNGEADALAQVQAWRTDGVRVQVLLGSGDEQSALAYARQIGIPQVLAWRDGAFVEISPTAEPVPSGGAKSR